MKRVLTLVFCIALTTGCASVRSILPGTSDGGVGSQMLEQAEETKQLGKSWKEGQRLVEKGNKLLSKSEGLAQESREVKAEAEGLIARGNALINSSEQSYEVAFGGTEASQR